MQTTYDGVAASEKYEARSSSEGLFNNENSPNNRHSFDAFPTVPTDPVENWVLPFRLLVLDVVTVVVDEVAVSNAVSVTAGTDMAIEAAMDGGKP